MERIRIGNWQKISQGVEKPREGKIKHESRKYLITTFDV